MEADVLARIPLVPVHSGMLTSYISGRGESRHPNGDIPRVEELTTVGAAPGLFMLAPMAAAHLNSLDRAVQAGGGAPLRLTEAYRPVARQQQARAAYLTWMQAGRPAPGSAGWRPGMKAAYVAPPGESHHGWGAAVDIDVGALRVADHGAGTHESLAAFWEIASFFGWHPVIQHPQVSASESWHFEHFGGLSQIRALMQMHRPRYRAQRVSSTIALAGCALTGTLPAALGNHDVYYVQARLLAEGLWCGEPDGQLGPLTSHALEDAIGRPPKHGEAPSALAAELDARNVGLSAMLRC